MKKLFLLGLLLAISTFAFADVFYPEATGYVVDTSGILTPEAIMKLTEICKSVEPKAQMAIVTVKTTQPLTDEQYSMKLAEKWKVGFKGKDNGIILLVVTKDRRVRIEVGYGLEGVINDAKAGRILDESVVPYLRNNDWNNGILSGAIAIKKEVTK